MRRAGFAAFALAACSTASAHAAGDAQTGWTLAPAASLPLLISAILYGAGLWKLHRRRADASSNKTHLGRATAFALGWLWLAAALLSPVDALGAKLFWVHMVQHEMLMLLAAPFLVLGRPLPLFLWALPTRVRARVGAALHSTVLQSIWRGLTSPMMGWFLHAAALWLWHAPALFDSALRDPIVHDLQHLTFLLTALLFWSALLTVRTRSGAVAGVLYLFTTAAHSSVLGALITLASQPWYHAYLTSAPAFGWFALEDQQIGGLIMWVPGSMVYVAFALVLLWRWIRADGTRQLPAMRVGN